MAGRVRDRIEDRMMGGGGGILSGAVLSALSAFYGAGVGIRAACYGAGVFRKTALACKVISVGNITVGGSGKTPVTIFLARMFGQRGVKAAVLSRGYKRAGRGIETVSDGSEALLTPARAGDEPYLMAARLEGVPVIVGRDRVEAGRYALERFSPDVLILDDGFQHIRLERDLDIVLFDSERGLGNGRLLPRGPLREPVAGMKRADVLLVKGGGDFALPHEAAGKKTFQFTYAPRGLVDLEGNACGLESLRGKRVLALAGIAGPEGFVRTLRGCGAIVEKKIIYPDHHWYGPGDIERIRRESEGLDDVVTTEKDAVRLMTQPAGNLKVKALAIDVEMSDGKGFMEFLCKRLGLGM